MKENDLSYAAGLMDGEGCISISTDQRLSVTLAMADNEAVDWLHETFGGSVRTFFNKPNGRLMYQWTATADIQYMFLESILSYLKLQRRVKTVRVAL